MSLNTWLAKNLQYVLSTVEVFFVLFSCSSWLLWWTDLLVLFFVRVTSCQLRSALASALDSAKYVRCEGPAVLSSLSSVAQKTSSQRCVMHVGSDILPGRDLKLTFLSVTDTYVRTYITRVDPSFKASCYSNALGNKPPPRCIYQTG